MKRQTANFYCLIFKTVTASRKGSHACQQLGENKRFDEIVVRSRVQPSQEVLQRASRRQDNDGDPPELLTQTRHQAHAIAIGQPQVEQDKLRHAELKLMQRILFPAYPYDIKSLICKGETYAVAEIQVVFN